MKLIALHNLPEMDSDLVCITKGKVYEGDLTPVIYDTYTLKPCDPSYVVICDDKKYRKYDSVFFITLEENRDIKLKKLEV